MAKDPVSIAKKWAGNLSAATQAIQQGVQAVTTSPTQSAAAQSNAYLAGVQRAVSTGKWQAGLQRVTLQDWQQAMIQKGIPRIGSGATQAVPKFTAFMQQFLPYVQQGLQQLASQPRGTLDQNIQRAVFMMNWNAQFRRT